MTSPPPPGPRGTPSTSRVVVLGAGGGQGASTVAALIAALHAEKGRAAVLLARPDDPVTAWETRPAGGGGEGGEVVVDAGPHAVDGTARPGDVAVIACAATAGAIERATRLLAEADDRGDDVKALVVCARSAREQRRGMVSMVRAARADARVVRVGFDEALAGDGRIALEALAPATRDAGRHLLSLLGG